MGKDLPRPPVVVVLGHVDHGKTTLLDYIRKSHLAENEIGGITQKIGAYEIDVDFKDYHIKKITFIDTPGHEAFTKLRLRGAEVADIAVLVIDAIDSVMPQTIESIYHIKNAQIPLIVAVNKIDMPQSDLEKVKKDLLKQQIAVEGMGGDIPFIPISAKTGQGVNDLLEMILFTSSIKDLRYSQQNCLKAYVLESKKEKAGVIASVIIKDGFLRVGDTVYINDEEIKVRSMITDRGLMVKEIFPSTPVVLLGFKNLPEPGSVLSTKKIKNREKKQDLEIKKEDKNPLNFLNKEEKKKLKLMIKTDSFGSLEAILSQIKEKENIEIILASVGEVNRSDLLLAKISKAIIIAFNVFVSKDILTLAETEKIIIKSYSLIYELLEELEEVELILKEKEKKTSDVKGEAKILANFIIEKERIAGIKVLKGKINLNDQIEIYRNSQLIGKTKIVSLKQRAKLVNEVKKNEEAGIIFYPKLDFSIGDVIKSYSI